MMTGMNNPRFLNEELFNSNSNITKGAKNNGKVIFGQEEEYRNHNR